jgi:hypothetical protein
MRARHTAAARPNERLPPLLSIDVQELLDLSVTSQRRPFNVACAIEWVDYNGSQCSVRLPYTSSYRYAPPYTSSFSYSLPFHIPPVRAPLWPLLIEVTRHLAEG